MIIKTLQERVKTIIVKQEVEGVMQEFPVEKVVGYNIARLETDNVLEFAEWINPRTNSPYKSKAYLITPQGFVMVKHSFKELQKFKSDLHRRVEVKGFKR